MFCVLPKMALFWHLVCFLALSSHIVCSDNSESKPSTSAERDDSSNSHQLAYESNSYPTQSMHSSNGYNNNQNSMSLSESNNAQNYGSGHQTNDQFDQKDRKTLILAIPVKLRVPNSEQDNYDQSVSQSESEPSQVHSQTLLYSKSLPYQSSYSRQPSFLSSDSDNSDSSLSKGASLPPLSHKIYSSIDSQLKSASYSTVNTQKSVSEHPSTLSSTNEQKYKNSYQIKDHKLVPNQYVTDVNTNRDYPINGEYKGLTLKNEDDSDYEVVNSRPILRPNNIKSPQMSPNYESQDSYGARLKQKEYAKQLYESIPNNKPEYGDDLNNEEEENDKRTVDLDNFYYTPKDYHNSAKNTGFNLKNNKKTQFIMNPIEPKPSIGSHFHHNHKGLGQSLPVYSAEPFDGWPQYYYSKPNIQANDWSGISETIDTNLLNLNLFNGFKINKQGKENLRNPMYAPAYDILADSQLKAASHPIPMKTLQNSKIYGQAAKYQSVHPSLNLFAGQPLNIRDYGLIDINGDIYPAPIVGQPPRKQHKPLKHKELLVGAEYNTGNRDSIKPHRRNPLLLRPSFMSGLRSAANKPLANYSPFASASTTQSFLSVLPSLQTSLSISAKSIPRQIFPLLYG